MFSFLVDTDMKATTGMGIYSHKVLGYSDQRNRSSFDPRNMYNSLSPLNPTSRAENPAAPGYQMRQLAERRRPGRNHASVLNAGNGGRPPLSTDTISADRLFPYYLQYYQRKKLAKERRQRWLQRQLDRLHERGH